MHIYVICIENDLEQENVKYVQLLVLVVSNDRSMLPRLQCDIQIRFNVDM